MSRKRGLLVICSLVAMLPSCTTTDLVKTNYENKIKTAYEHLENGAFGQVRENLKSATKIANEEGYDQTELKCLLAEAHLGAGDTLEAYHQARELFEKNDRDPYANELLGKIYLKESGFLGAEQYFLTAQAEYEAAEDVSRAKDLVALARGLTAYEAGSPRLANHYWQDIQNLDLRYFLDRAQKEMTAALSNNERRW